MAMADTVRQSNGLPSLNLADLEKIKKETAAYSHRFPMPSALNMPAPPLASPSIYSGPPPPYSYPPSTASSVVGANNGYISPPESRRTTEDEKEPVSLPKLQSLPSIHEALGNDQHISINSLLSKSAAVSQAPQAPSQRSPTSPIAHSRPDLSTTIKTSTSFSQGYPSAYRNPEYSEKPPRPRFSPHLPSDIPPHHYPPSLTPQHSKQHLPGTVPSPLLQSRPTASVGHQVQPSPPYESVSRPTHTMNNHYTYSPYHASYAYPIPPSAVPSYHPPPSLPQPTWRSLGSDIDRAEEARKAASKSSPKYQPYGESVKRQLDIFDLETSLNEIAEGSGRTLNFTKQYSYQAYQHQRSGPTPSSMPSIEECDEMIKQQHRVLTSMERIREVIVKQQADLAERKKLDQSFNNPEDYDEENLFGDKSEGGGGFAGADAKKKRGRAAPPGRCHSCNRAETPEWRRGPDGARTLCNACGLHYAKLTRKMGSKASTGSNLRPKESSPLSQ